MQKPIKHRYETDGEKLVREINMAAFEGGVTYADISRRTGIARSTLYRYMGKPECIPLGALCKIARAAGMTKLELLTGGYYG